jgi:hypothetical protein
VPYFASIQINPFKPNPMKSIRILFACVLGLFASAALVRAEEHAEKKQETAEAHAPEKKAETAAAAHSTEHKPDAAHGDKEHAKDSHAKADEHK